MAGEKSDGLPELVRERAAGAPTPLHQLVLVFTVALFGALIGTTQWLAAHFDYDPRLGRPIYSVPADVRSALGIGALVAAGLGLQLASKKDARRRAPVVLIASAILGLLWHGPLYHPGRLFEWWSQLDVRADSAALLVQARLIAGVLFLGLGAGVYATVRPTRVRVASDSHGSARWGSGDEFRATDEEVKQLSAGQGLGGKLLLGRHADGSLMILRETAGHLLTVATTQSGKTTGTVLPNGLAYAGSMVFTDPKGEIFFVTASHRRKRLGHTVYVLDPFEATLLEGQNKHDMMAFFNPLRLIPTTGPEGKLALVRARALTETLILESTGENAFWDRMARQVGTGFILYIAYQFDCGCTPETAFPVETPYGRDLLTLRFLTTLGSEDFDAVLTHMCGSQHPLVRRVANVLLGADEKTRQNIMTSVQSQLAFLDAPQMAAVLGEYVPDATGRTSVPNPLPHANLGQLKNRGVRQTVYLVIPPPFLEANGPWVRLMIVAISDIMTRTIGRPDLPLVVVLEELGNIGKVDAVRRGVTLVAGYGIRFWMIVQDLAQVEEIYGKAWRTMFANARVKQLFGTNDLQTAKELSELMGETTVYSDSGNEGKSLDNAGVIGKGKSISDGASEKGRRLLSADEVVNLPNEKQILQVRGHLPTCPDKLNYLDMPEVRGLYAPNPMYS
jgi:type IV secretion system protein VirD4